MAESEPTIFIVDDDGSVREGRAEPARAVKPGVETFTTAPQSLESAATPSMMRSW